MVTDLQYIHFRTEHKQFDFTFLYPVAWKVREIEQESGGEVFVAGPRNPENTFSTALTVSVLAGTLPEEAAAQTLAKYRHLEGFREMACLQSALLGEPATEIAFTYILHLPLQHLHPRSTLILDRRVYFRRENGLYELMYSSSEADKYAEAFLVLVRTFRFCPGRETAALLALNLPAGQCGQ